MKGEVFYGMHFYPGVAEYREQGKDAFRVFLNEDTIRAMGPSFAGRTVYVMHVDEVDKDIDRVRETADGGVLESFFNEADGKHWAKFIVCSDRGLTAVKSKRMGLSNCYMPKSYKRGGVWNGVSYDKEVAHGEYEHLAIVPNPRYNESKIMTPEEFKAYNENRVDELKRLANNTEETEPVKFKLFKRAKIENAEGLDLGTTIVELPKSKREVSLET